MISCDYNKSTEGAELLSSSVTKIRALPRTQDRSLAGQRPEPDLQTPVGSPQNKQLPTTCFLRLPQHISTNGRLNTPELCCLSSGGQRSETRRGHTPSLWGPVSWLQHVWTCSLTTSIAGSQVTLLPSLLGVQALPLPLSYKDTCHWI